MPSCPVCQQLAAKRNARERGGRQKYACRTCRRTFTEDTASAFSGYRWPADVILTAVRWYLALSGGNTSAEYESAMLWVLARRWCAGRREHLSFLTPDTVVGRHRQGWRLFWRWTSGSRDGRPHLSPEVRELIMTMSRENRLWGTERVRGELLRLGTREHPRFVGLFRSGSRASMVRGAAHTAGTGAVLRPHWLTPSQPGRSCNGISLIRRQVTVAEPSD
jgi:transposase-like protein